MRISRNMFLSVCVIAGVVCVILVAKSKVMLVGKKRRQRRESSEIGHTALHKKAGGESLQ